MLELTAQGADLRQRWRTVLRAEQTLVLGRDPSLPLSTPWDAAISRRHVQLAVAERALDVQRLATAADPYAKDSGWNCYCEIDQLGGAELDACQTDLNATPVINGDQQVNGWWN